MLIIFYTKKINVNLLLLFELIKTKVTYLVSV